MVLREVLGISTSFLDNAIQSVGFRSGDKRREGEETEGGDKEEGEEGGESVKRQKVE